MLGHDESINARLRKTKSRIASYLVALINPIFPLLALSGLGLVFGRYLVDRATPMTRRAADGLEDIRTGQAHVLNLCNLSIQLLDERFHAVDMGKKTLEGHLRSTTMTADEADKARDIIDHLEAYSAQIFGELYRRRDIEASIRGRLDVTDEFLTSLNKA